MEAGKAAKKMVSLLGNRVSHAQRPLFVSWFVLFLLKLVPNIRRQKIGKALLAGRAPLQYVGSEEVEIEDHPLAS